MFKLKKQTIPLFAILFLGVIVLFSASFTVRFTETAVKTRFGSANENSIITEPGFKWKLPYPFESVTKYDTRIRMVETRSETVQTADDFQIIVESYLSYKVADPLKFFRSFSNAGERAIDHFNKAENDVLRDLLRSALGETSTYKMSDLFASQSGASVIPLLEQQLFDLLVSGGNGGQPLSDYGILITSVGIDRIVLPEETTSAVINRMGANRDRLAERYESEGRSQARAIRAEAISNADRIRAFAQRRADEILAKGEAEAAPYLAQQNINPDLAVFIQNIKLMREAMSKKFTLIFSTSDYGMQLFDPDILKQSQGNLPIPSQDPDMESEG
ncbi:MAG: SPFH domain-containing protein [Phycisphaerales bacterium]|nr:SPFH domain-containing protein [Phycisphaerales bacterium]